MDGELMRWSREWRVGRCEDLGQDSFLCDVHKCKYGVIAGLRAAIYVDLRVGHYPDNINTTMQHIH